MSEPRVLRELVQELVGAEMMARILRESWDAMRPELKVELAESVGMAALGKFRSLDDWDLRGVVSSYVGKLADEWLSAHEDEIRTVVHQRIEATWNRYVDEVVRRCCDNAVKEVGSRVEEALRRR